MAPNIREETRLKLERIPVLLREEFPHSQPGEVDRSVGMITRDLVADARIEDFLPVLVHRYAREQLLAEVHRTSGEGITGPD